MGILTVNSRRRSTQRRSDGPPHVRRRRRCCRCLGVHVLVVRKRAVIPPVLAVRGPAPLLQPRRHSIRRPARRRWASTAPRLAKLDAYMAKVVADGRVAGMSTLLARHGQVVAEKTYGVRSLATGAPMTQRHHLPHLLHVEADHRRRDDDPVRGRAVAARRSDHQVRARVQGAEGDDRRR